MKEILKASFGSWHIQCIPQDGGRISVLKYEGYDLLTTNPPGFKPPGRFYGEYETRPVFGYDDCFPSVDSCIYPDQQTVCRDHGELCWKEWKVEIMGNSLICSTDCLNPEVTFKRILDFTGNILTWRFEVVNESEKTIPFIHVMHALFPLEKIQYIKLPKFVKIFDEEKSVEHRLKNPHELENYLLTTKSGDYKMLLLKEICAGSIILGFQKGLNLNISFEIKLFPTIGIWWNNAGYPKEEGLQRTECAFEPIPGTSSDLSKSIRDGIYLVAKPGETLTWEIFWTIEYDVNLN